MIKNGYNVSSLTDDCEPGPLEDRRVGGDHALVEPLVLVPRRVLNLQLPVVGLLVEDLQRESGLIKNCCSLIYKGVPCARGLAGWVDLNFECSTVCPILPGLMGIWQ